MHIVQALFVAGLFIAGLIVTRLFAARFVAAILIAAIVALRWTRIPTLAASATADFKWARAEGWLDR